MHLLRKLAIAANVLFVLWIFYNGLNEGWKGTPPEIASYVGLALLLLLNSYLLFEK
ncbi:MAG: hypothetical protein H6506_04235 [Calditrichaeota bacterium]|nr:hypothetical protein [Calditrichota bacterium]MCB9366031.1 hypothetical protein [Calditrichota bacterium]MCB9391843.1 hypothetical protein [Calditrichota bacterium]